MRKPNCSNVKILLSKKTRGRQRQARQWNRVNGTYLLRICRVMHTFTLFYNSKAAEIQEYRYGEERIGKQGSRVGEAEQESRAAE
jgi:hypothetical protein